MRIESKREFWLRIIREYEERKSQKLGFWVGDRVTVIATPHVRWGDAGTIISIDGESINVEWDSIAEALTDGYPACDLRLIDW